jgi:hypothetical protein
MLSFSCVQEQGSNVQLCCTLLFINGCFTHAHAGSEARAAIAARLREGLMRCELRAWKQAVQHAKLLSHHMSLFVSKCGAVGTTRLLRGKNAKADGAHTQKTWQCSCSG